MQIFSLFSNHNFQLLLQTKQNQATADLTWNCLKSLDIFLRQKLCKKCLGSCSGNLKLTAVNNIDVEQNETSARGRMDQNECE